MTRPEAIACVDIGKTNRRVILIDRASRAEIDSASEPNAPVTTGPWPALDLEGTMDFIEAALGRFAVRADIRRIAISTHGAAFVLLRGNRPALPALDYEHPGPDDYAADYAALRPPFAETFSPALPSGLNAGRGLYYLLRRAPEAFASGDTILSLNQYVAFRLSGVRASERTSLGCHTDLWNTGAGTFSSLVERLGWTGLFPAFQRPGDPLGPILPEIATRTGLPADCEVLCGIHDSNATLVPYLDGAPGRATVFSTGTWIIAFSLGGGTERLAESRDCLANTDWLGRPVPSARMMGGREMAILTGGASDTGPLSGPIHLSDLPLPGFVPGTGPFGRSEGQLPRGWDRRPARERAILASVYCAFCCATMARLVDGAGPIAVEGVFARNPAFVEALARATGADIFLRPDSTGTTAGLTLLAGLGKPPAPVPAPEPSDASAELADLFRAWSGEANSR